MALSAWAPRSSHTTASSSDPIEVHSPSRPDIVVIVKPNLICIVDLTEGLDKDGILIIKSP